jgi:hypothetical protein
VSYSARFSSLLLLNKDSIRHDHVECTSLPRLDVLLHCSDGKAATLLLSLGSLIARCTQVLVNAMSPPHLVPLANGLAQSSVSLARFIGEPTSLFFVVIRRRTDSIRSSRRSSLGRHALGSKHRGRTDRAPLAIQLQCRLHRDRRAFLPLGISSRRILTLLSFHKLGRVLRRLPS